MTPKVEKVINDAIIEVNSCTEFWQNPPSVETEVAEIIKKLEGAKTITDEAEQLAELETIADRIGVLWSGGDVLEDSSGLLTSAMDGLNSIIDKE